MNKYNAVTFLPLVQALAEGKTIQIYRHEAWDDVTDVAFLARPEEYRIKPEPIKKWYRVALMKHGTNTVSL